MLASSSLKAGLSSPAQGRDGEPEQRLKSEWWGWILISRVPCGQLHSEGQTNTPTLLHSPPGFFFVWKRLKRALHPAVRRLPLHLCVCVCARLTPPRVKRTHRTAALYDRRWAKERERERERKTESDVLTSRCYWPGATRHCPMADTQKHPPTLKIRRNNM